MEISLIKAEARMTTLKDNFNSFVDRFESNAQEIDDLSKIVKLYDDSDDRNERGVELYRKLYEDSQELNTVWQARAERNWTNVLMRKSRTSELEIKCDSLEKEMSDLVSHKESLISLNGKWHAEFKQLREERDKYFQLNADHQKGIRKEPRSLRAIQGQVGRLSQALESEKRQATNFTTVSTERDKLRQELKES